MSQGPSQSDPGSRAASRTASNAPHPTARSTHAGTTGLPTSATSGQHSASGPSLASGTMSYSGSTSNQMAAAAAPSQRESSGAVSASTSRHSERQIALTTRPEDALVVDDNPGTSNISEGTYTSADGEIIDLRPSLE